MRIRAVQACELPVLQEIERAAGQPFADIGMVEIAQDEPYPLAVLAACEQAGPQSPERVQNVGRKS